LCAFATVTFGQEPIDTNDDLEEIEEIDEEFDVGRALEELLVEDEAMDPTAASADAMNDMEKAIEPAVDIVEAAADAQVTPAVTEQFNRLTDVIMRKVNLAVQNKHLDPLNLNFRKNKNRRRKQNIKKRKAVRRRKSQKKNKRKNKRKQKKNKTKRLSRGLNDEVEMNEEDDMQGDDTEATLYLSDDEEEGADEMTEVDDEARAFQADEDDEGDADETDEARALRRKKKNKKNRRKSNKKRRKPKRKPSRKTRVTPIIGVLTGLSSMERSGDVVVTGEPGNSDIVADFTLGPMNLVAIRKLGKKGKKQRRSKASVSQLKGRMTITFNNGSTKISNLEVFTPDEIQIDGLLTKRKKQKQSDKMMTKRVRQVNPIVVKRLKMVTRDVLQTIRVQ